MEIRFYGAAREVTGSCFELSGDGRRILIDCGMNQGTSDRSRAFPFDPPAIDAVFLTHAHIDHSGMIPRLVREGFRGKIITTAATADLCEIMLLDSAHIQEKDAEWMTRKNLRSGRGGAVEPMYTAEDVENSLALFERKFYGRTETLFPGLRYRFTDAGHILGSASLEILYRNGSEKTIVFSGDIGKKGNPIVQDPEHRAKADFVVMESTYGNRRHKSLDESVAELAEAVRSTFSRGGNVLIPSFAVGRTQDILYTLNKLVRDGRLKPLDVYVDSPLAEEATKIYVAHPEYFDQEARQLFRRADGGSLKLHFTRSAEESQRINGIRSGAVIIAGSGMCEGGRIRHHLKHNLWRPECSVVFVGFQARGTLGRKIVDGEKTVHLLGETVAVKARIYTIGGFSAHGDQPELLEWLGLFLNRPEIFIVHGEENAALEFEKTVREKLGLVTHVPHRGDSFTI